jgi:sporulation protein YlmC with PRC-barrel domain
MKEIPLKAKIHCTDGTCGESTNVIIDRNSLKVSHIAIREEALPDNPTRLVPIAKIADALHGEIYLSCEVSNMAPFIVLERVQDLDTGASGKTQSPQYVSDDNGLDTVRVQDIPAGELAVKAGMTISASDGKVGKLDEFLLDPKHGAITHLLMLKGHLWGKKDVAIPVDDVKSTDDETIYLSIDKNSVSLLPAVSTRRS